MQINSIIKKRLTAGIVALIFFCAIFSPIFAVQSEAVSQSQLNALKQQQQALAEQKHGIQDQADALNNKVNAQTEKLKILNEKLEVTNQELENLSKQIAIYTNSIAEMENQLNEYQEQEQQYLKRYKVRLRAMEENGKIPYFSILLGATSFEDLLSRIDDIREIMEYDSDLIKDVKQAQVNVKKAQTDMEAEMAEQQVAYTEYQDKQADLTSQQAEAAAVLATLNTKSAEYAKQLASVQTLQSSISKQVSNMQAQLDEQKRIEAEEKAAQAASSDNSSSSPWYGDSAGSATGQEIVDYAKKFLGVSYVYGGSSPSGFDCSGLVYYCYRHYGYRINRTAAAQSYNGVSVSSSDLQPGDIVLFSDGSGSYIGHCGIYVGGGNFIHAPHTGDVVKISSLSADYYATHYAGARRIV